MATAEHREPCDSRGSCTVLGAPGGETPPGDSTEMSIAAGLALQKIGIHLRTGEPGRDVLLLISRPEAREGPTALISIQNNSGLPQEPRLGSEVG
jgi:hypothetical protein